MGENETAPAYCYGCGCLFVGSKFSAWFSTCPQCGDTVPHFETEWLGYRTNSGDYLLTLKHTGQPGGFEA